MQAVLDSFISEARQEIGKGQLVDFIPALAEVNPAGLGLSVMNTRGEMWSAGDARTGFSVQSISKLIAYVFAMKNGAPDLNSRVHRKPAGHAFNSLIRLEEENGVPRNPFVNGGALVVSDILRSLSPDPQAAMLEFVCGLSGNPDLFSDQRISDCEYTFGDRNTAIAYLIKSFGNLHSDVEGVLRLYFHNCALNMSCEDLARFFGFLANGGVCSTTQARVVSAEETIVLEQLLSDCGLYEESAEFFTRVGLPTKSGVGGGIVGVVPGKYSFCVWSPELNEHGNSVAGIRLIEMLANHFAPGAAAEQAYLLRC